MIVPKSADDPIVLLIEFYLPPYNNLKGGQCLTYIGKDGIRGLIIGFKGNGIMKIIQPGFNKIVLTLAWFLLLACSVFAGGSGKVLRVAVVGDTGIGERGFRPGFLATQEAMVKQKPDVFLHLGDFVYRARSKYHSCGSEYINEVRETLAEPFQLKLFVVGDNDLDPDERARCWNAIDPMDDPLDPEPEGAPGPREFEGTRVIGDVLFVLLNTEPWSDPTPWLKPRIERARSDGLWVIVALHEPPVTTAWFLDKRATVLKQVNALQPDLVFSGHQHSYERFHPMGIPGANGSIPVTQWQPGAYRKGDGTIHIVSGGGGATLKPFADLQDYQKRTAPKPVFDALASRALMNHFLLLEISARELNATTYRVCPHDDPDDDMNPRWRSHKKFWDGIVLECDGRPVGTTVFERFRILAE